MLDPSHDPNRRRLRGAAHGCTCAASMTAARFGQSVTMTRPLVAACILAATWIDGCRAPLTKACRCGREIPNSAAHACKGRCAVWSIYDASLFIRLLSHIATNGARIYFAHVAISVKPHARRGVRVAICLCESKNCGICTVGRRRCLPQRRACPGHSLP